MLSMVVVGATLMVMMVAKNDKGEMAGEWKGPLNGVMWRVGGRRDARAAAGGGRGTRDGMKASSAEDPRHNQTMAESKLAMQDGDEDEDEDEDEDNQEQEQAQAQAQQPQQP